MPTASILRSQMEAALADRIPKSGNYGQTTGVWNFTIAGTKRTVKAHILDEKFLSKYSDGSIRFYQGDRLKVKLRERQVIEGAKTRMEYEIVEVLEYHQAHTAVRATLSTQKKI